MMPANLTALHEQALDRFRFIATVEADQRRSELEALRFEAGDQWPEDAKTSRAGLPANTALRTPAVPARPMLTMRTLDQPLAQIDSMAQGADLSIRIIPKDGKANKKTGEVIQGLVRSIQADSHASAAYLWGFKRMRGCGRGYWRVNKTYASDVGGFDQVVRIEPIENGGSVYLDPMPKWVHGGGFYEPEFAFVTEDISESDYTRRYGTSKLATAGEGETLAADGDHRKHWVIEGKEGGTYYRIAEYFYATYDTTPAVDPSDSALKRDLVTRKIMWCKLNGVEILDGPQEWDGRYIPIIQVSGNTYNIGGQVRYEGIVQPNMSPCQMLNYMVSSAAETIGLRSLAPWIGIAGQFEGFEAWWDQANTRNFSKLEYNATTDRTGSTLLPPPTRNNDEPAIRAYGEMIGLFTNFIRSTTGVSDAALGHLNPNDRSGKAIEALKRASEQGSSGWLRAQADAIRHTGVVVVDLLPHVYDRPGRVERILGVDGEPESVMLNAPFTRGQDGEPHPAQPPVSPGLMQRMKSAVGMGAPAPESPEVEHYNLAEGEYSVIVTVGKTEETRRQEMQVGMGMLAQAAPELVPRFADLWVASMDIPNAEAIAERIKPPGVDEDAQMPPEAQAQIQQLQQALEEVKELADANQTKLTIAAASDANKMQVAQLKAQTDLTVAELKVGMLDLVNQVKILSQMIGQSHQASMADQQRQAAVDHQRGQQAHELGMADVSHAQALEQRAQPPPIDPNAALAVDETLGVGAE